MKVKRTVSWTVKTLYQTLTSSWRKQIYYVTNVSDWSFFWDAYYITRELQETCGLPARITDNVTGLRNQIIQFGDRYAYLNGTFRRVHPSNHVFLTWFHGSITDPDPHLQQLFLALDESKHLLQKIVVSCETSKQTLIQFGIPPSQLVKIPLGVDLTLFFPAGSQVRANVRSELGIPQEAFCIGSFQKDGVGWHDGFEPKLIKGPDIFLQVVEKLARQYDNLFVLLTGPARGYVKQGLDRLRVPYLHHVLANYQDIARYYQAIDLYLITSRDEGGPKALLESWATGVPVVSTRVGMSADLIQHGQNGMITDVENVEALAMYAIDLIEDSVLYEQCRERALIDVKQYAWPLVAKQYHLLYQPYF